MMKLKHLLTISLLAFFGAASLQSTAALIDNGSYTTDTATGLEWLDLTTTNDQSLDEVTSRLGTGDLVGWRFATRTEYDVLTMTPEFLAFAPDAHFMPSVNNSFAATLGLYLLNEPVPPEVITTDYTPGNYYAFKGLINDVSGLKLGTIFKQEYDVFSSSLWNIGSTTYDGVFLVRSVPESSSLWLMLIGAFGLFARRRANFYSSKK